MENRKRRLLIGKQSELTSDFAASFSVSHRANLLLFSANEHRQWLIIGSINNSAELLYNTAHPAYGLAEDEGEDAQGDYLLDIALEGAIQFVLGRPNREDGTADFHPLETGKILGLAKPRDVDEIPSAAHQEIQRFISEVRWRRFEEA